MEQVLFNCVVFFRTERNHPDSTGHPVDSVELNNYIRVYFNPKEFDGSAEKFSKFESVLTHEVNRFLNSIFENKVIFGTSSPTGGMSSERHAIRVDDIRNVVVTDFQETIVEFYESFYDVSL